MWVRIGKPRHGEQHAEMMADRAAFKLALRQCKRQEAQIKADKLAGDLLNKDAVAFWQEVQLQSCSKVPLAESVGGISGPHEIANHWADHYKQLFNSVPRDGISALCLQIQNEIQNNQNIRTSLESGPQTFSVGDVVHALKQLKKRKAAGPDGISAEHLLYAGHRLHVLLSICFNSFILHGYLPKSIIFSCVTPVLKDKAGNASDMSNYRPIALTPVLSKVLERMILQKTLQYLTTCDNQFGFKSNHSTDLCIYALKETIQYFISHDTPVFLCFKDASKAFDKINHLTLFSKLFERKFPLLLLRLLLYWYTNQEMCTRWGNEFSYIFTVSNGVRQGDVLSVSLSFRKTHVQ